MVKLMSMMAAVALLGMTACGGPVEAQTPDEAPKSEPQAPLSRPEVIPQSAPGGGCYSYCDDRYCYICRTWPDGSCGCILD